MIIQTLGTASGKAVLHRQASAIWIKTDQTNILIDAGDNVTRQVIKFGYGADDCDTIVVSHTHPDHVGGLPALLQWMHLEKRARDLKIYMPKGVISLFQKAMPLFNIFTERWDFSMSWFGIEHLKTITCGELNIIPIKNTHVEKLENFSQKAGFKTEAFSFQIKDGQKNILFTADVPNLNHLTPVAGKCELLISECTHVSIEQGGQFQQRHRIKQLVFTHIPPELEPDCGYDQDNNQSVTFAADGDCFEV